MLVCRKKADPRVTTEINADWPQKLVAAVAVVEVFGTML